MILATGQKKDASDSVVVSTSVEWRSFARAGVDCICGKVTLDDLHSLHRLPENTICKIGDGRSKTE